MRSVSPMSLVPLGNRFVMLGAVGLLASPRATWTSGLFTAALPNCSLPFILLKKKMQVVEMMIFFFSPHTKSACPWRFLFPRDGEREEMVQVSVPRQLSGHGSVTSNSALCVRVGGIAFINPQIPFF